ncbi:unnamed protein product [Heligmosomoides polygyrus]|uniref:MFS domain-containing protein n=1 Tax=Heligmosomoides polygyrus TaxID=6339 RepID=A0A3P8BR39_HELPZ|nr:unnamed protein product [Heligmosomoides polygyrus]
MAEEDAEAHAVDRLRASSALTPPDERARASSLIINYLHLDADKVLSAYGKFGRYQMITYLITNSVHVLFAINMMVMPFITEDPKFECQITPPEGVHWNYNVVDKCTVTDSNNWTLTCDSIPGARYVYNDTNHQSLASEFNLVCENYESVEHGASVFMLGGMLVAPIITQLSDLFGRRLTFLIPLYVGVVANLICAVAPSYTVFLIFRFISGVATTGFSVIGWVLCMESVALEFRSLIPLMGTITWVTGYIRTSSRFNRVQIPLHECKSANHLEEQGKKRTFFDIFKNPALVLHLILNSYILIVMNGTYWALSLFSTELSEDKMTGFFLSGLVEIPAGFISIALLIYLDRKTVSVVSLTLQAVCMICALYLPLSPQAVMVFPLLAKICNSIVWCAQPLLYTESTPTSVRNEAIHKSAPTLVIAVMSITSAMLVLVMPETKDKKLPEDIDEFELGPPLRFINKKKKGPPQLQEVCPLKLRSSIL